MRNELLRLWIEIDLIILHPIVFSSSLSTLTTQSNNPGILYSLSVTISSPSFRLLSRAEHCLN